ncbi:hypothetical protein L873DRAFT_1164545 [Choiromyces venosus 120613-1]|uniref:Uncharacterized protein n=1 Tax=Choiromyces venosus 120613-1 TaxID=1336337 RepID=A0A3N4JFF8_9PEZI|nr:hypothetical protein L873DRAFT_1164545 [Choiromyces venosus 120613-1]
MVKLVLGLERHDSRRSGVGATEFRHLPQPLIFIVGTLFLAMVYKCAILPFSFFFSPTNTITTTTSTMVGGAGKGEEIRISKLRQSMKDRRMDGWMLMIWMVFIPHATNAGVAS